MAHIPVSARQGVPILEGEEIVPLELLAGIELATSRQAGLRLKNSREEVLVVGYDVPAQKIFVDRRAAGPAWFDPGFGRHIQAAPLEVGSGVLDLQMFVDKSSVEVFAGQGSIVLTDQFFFCAEVSEIEVYSLDGRAHIDYLDSWKCASIWRSLEKNS
jgi:sucrose-6-phosphate hydrolase SacC (GH32 family)